MGYVCILLSSTWMFTKAYRRSDLLARAQALQRKQRAGCAAAPLGTPSRSQTPPSIRKMEVPDFTPIRRPFPSLPAPLPNSIFEKFTSSHPQLPASLLAPRYSHLLDEAVAVSQDRGAPDLPMQATELTAEESFTTESDISQNLSSSMTSEPASPPATGLGTRVKGIISSYLHTLAKPSSIPRPKPASTKPALPLPPPELRNKVRGPIATPIRPPGPKPVHPRDIVHLNHASLPTKPSGIPRAVQPRRLVELRPSPLPVSPERETFQRSRRSSGGSVKDLVRTFEDLDSSVDASRSIDMSRPSSVADFRQGVRPPWQ